MRYCNRHLGRDFIAEKRISSTPPWLKVFIRDTIFLVALFIICFFLPTAVEGQNDITVFTAEQITAGPDFNQIRDSESITAELESFRAYSMPMESILGYFSKIGEEERARFILELPQFGSWELELRKSDPRVRSGFQTIVKRDGELTYLPKRETGTYRGQVVGDTVKRVAASIRENHFSMHLQKEDDFIVLEIPDEQFAENGRLMVIAYLTEDLREDHDFFCGVDHNRGGGTQGCCPAKRTDTTETCKSVRIAIAADGAMVEKLGSPEAVEDELLDLFNVVQMRYDHPEVNIEYEIRTIFISASREEDPWYDEHPNSFGTLLGNFRNWGIAGGFQTKDYGVSSIWSARSFQGNAVGLAFSQKVGRQFGFNANQHYTNNSTRLIMVWAHELGHNFKAQHTASANNTYIMSPRVGSLNDQWHTNSIEVISNYKKEIDYLLDDCGMDSVSMDVQASFENVDSCSYSTHGAIYLDVDGGVPPYSYKWSDGSQDRDLVDVEGGEYFVTITDDSGESLVMGYYIRHPEPLYVSAVVHAHCDKTDLTNIWVHDWGGGTGEVEIEWWDGSDRDFRFNLPPGKYPLKVTDEYGCQLKDTVVFNGFEPIDLQFDVQPSECGRSNGQVVTEIIGGDTTSELSVTWFQQDEVNGWDLLNVDSGEYTVHVRNLGCNIRDTVQVDVVPIYDTIQEKLCSGEYFKLGDEKFYQEGEYSHWYQTEQDCDSVILLQLQVFDPDATVVLADGELKARSAEGTFQWYRCMDDGLEKIPGAVESTYQPDQNGRYALVHQVGICRDSSECIEALLSNVSSREAAEVVSWPNPHSNEFYVDIPGGSELKILSLTNALGEEVNAKVEQIYSDRFRISHHSAPGILFLLMKLDGEVAVEKLIHQSAP